MMQLDYFELKADMRKDEFTRIGIAVIGLLWFFFMFTISWSFSQWVVFSIYCLLLGLGVFHLVFEGLLILVVIALDRCLSSGVF